MGYFLTILYHLLNGEMKINVTERLPEGSNILIGANNFAARFLKCV